MNESDAAEKYARITELCTVNVNCSCPVDLTQFSFQICITKTVLCATNNKSKQFLSVPKKNKEYYVNVSLGSEESKYQKIKE
jgi:hypothetical protein